jgi:hypothetical protein
MNPFSSRLVCSIFLSASIVASSVAAEKSPPGDIPDNQIFVKYASAGGGYSLKVPEGWARIENGADVSFTDKYNGVKVAVTSAAAPPTAKNVFVESPLADLAKSGRAVKVKSVTEKKLPGGPVVLVKYDSDSEPNPVTNKILSLENEAYVFFKDGRLAILTLSAPRGADNVDQWKLMSESFVW